MPSALAEATDSARLRGSAAQAAVRVESAVQELDAIFAALAHTQRRAILARLARGETTVNELVAATALNQPTVSKHLKVLERAGLVLRSRTANFRPVRLNAARLAAAGHWIDGHRQVWQARFRRSDPSAHPLHKPSDESK